MPFNESRLVQTLAERLSAESERPAGASGALDQALRLPEPRLEGLRLRRTAAASTRLVPQGLCHKWPSTRILKARLAAQVTVQVALKARLAAQVPVQFRSVAQSRLEAGRHTAQNPY